MEKNHEMIFFLFFIFKVFSGTWVSETRVLHIGTQVFETQVPKSGHITNMFIKLA